MNIPKMTSSTALALAAMNTLLVGLVYASVQQSYRQNANDPQLEITEEVSAAVSKGVPPEQILPSESTQDIAKSLAVFLIIYDQDGKPLGSSAVLHGQTPVIPKGALEASKTKGLNALTWQPSPGTRLAAVIRPVKYQDKDIYILAGKNLRPVEDRIKNLGLMCLLAWAGLMVLSAVASLSLREQTGEELKAAAPTTPSTTITSV